jgi:hypothetical protein
LRWADLGEAEAAAVAAAATSSDATGPDAVAARETIDKLLECLEPEDALIVRRRTLDRRDRRTVGSKSSAGQSASLSRETKTTRRAESPAT